MGIDTLRIIAENGYRTGEWIGAAIDARHGSIYAALYQNSAQGVTEYWEPYYTDVESFAKRLVSLNDVLICGDGGKKYREIWEKHCRVKIGPSVWDRPSAANLIRIAAQRRLTENMQENKDLSPCYLRKVEAEVRLEERVNANKSHSDDPGRLK